MLLETGGLTRFLRARVIRKGFQRIIGSSPRIRKNIFQSANIRRDTYRQDGTMQFFRRPPFCIRGLQGGLVQAYGTKGILGIT